LDETEPAASQTIGSDAPPDVKPSNLSATDKKQVEDAEEVAETIED